VVGVPIQFVEIDFVGPHRWQCWPAVRRVSANCGTASSRKWRGQKTCECRVWHGVSEPLTSTPEAFLAINVAKAFCMNRTVVDTTPRVLNKRPATDRHLHAHWSSLHWRADVLGTAASGQKGPNYFCLRDSDGHIMWLYIFLSAFFLCVYAC